MKIIVVASLTKSLINFRRSLLEDLVKTGAEVVACAPEEDAETVGRLQAMRVSFRRMPMERASTNPVGDLKTLFALTGIFREERPDIVLAYTQKPIIYGGLAARLARVPRFYAMQSGLGFTFSEENRNALLRRLVSVLYRAGVKQADAVFVFNRDDEDEMRRHGILTGQRVVRVPGSGVDVSDYPHAPPPSGEPVFLVVARLMRDKGHYEFVEAARTLKARWPSARFQILGPFDANPASIAAKDLAAWRSEGVVEYLGETDNVRPFLAGSSVFVLPSYHREGLPRSILEAMSTGRAVITTDMPGCRETVEEGVNGFLVPPKDSSALADAMERFLKNPSLVQSMGAASRARAERKFAVSIVNAILFRTMGLTGDAGARPIARGGDGVRRILDVAAAGAGLIVFAPVMAILFVAVAMAMGRPAFFIQERAGLHRRPFRMIKFRTMTDARDAAGQLLSDEERVTKLGRFLRRSRLDELPELWNVLCGHMGLVGPRPLLPTSAPNLGPRGDERLSVRPGLTGWAQVNGNTLLSDDQKLALDLWYVRNRSLSLDAKIILKTIGVIVFGEKLKPAAEAGE
jgi:lipopolysaccharide/colanic/teichoic acid biosynthesis glycosyltransferase/glycosyltransferase involved in cell wall biosynthesis